MRGEGKRDGRKGDRVRVKKGQQRMGRTDKWQENNLSAEHRKGGLLYVREGRLGNEVTVSVEQQFRSVRFYSLLKPNTCIQYSAV